MKKIVNFLTVAVVVISLISCGGNKNSYQDNLSKMLTMQENIFKAINEAVKDQKIEQSEADKINKMLKDAEAFGKEMEEKAANLPAEEKEKIEKDFEDANKGRIEEIGKNVMETFSKLSDVEGVDLLELY